MASNGKVDWYAMDVLQLAEEASDEFLTQLAFQGEGLAKVNAPSAKPGFDTGFMRNAIYGIGPEGDHRSQSESEARSVADRNMVSTPQLDAHTAAIHGAAEYTIWWELRFSFLYNALEELRKIAPGVIKDVGRQKFK